MSAPSLFIAILHQLQDYDAAVLLAYLISQQAEKSPFKTTKGKLEAAFGNHVPAKRIQRAAAKLQQLQLLQCRVHLRRWTEYEINVAPLIKLLQKPLADTPYFPGLSQRDFPFLAQWQAISDQPHQIAATTQTPSVTKEEV